MTYIAETRVSGNHAAMGKSPPAVSGGLFESSLTISDILRAGVRRKARREEMAAAQLMPDSEDGAQGGDGNPCAVSGVEGALETAHYRVPDHRLTPQTTARTAAGSSGGSSLAAAARRAA